MITRKGIGLIAVAVAVFFLASATRVGWVHLADAVLWGVILLSLVVPWISMPGMSIRRTVSPSSSSSEIGHVEGDELPVTLELRNRWWLPRSLVTVSYDVNISTQRRSQKSVFAWSSPKSTRSFDAPLTLERRGAHTMGDLVIEIAGPFGLFRRRRTIESKHSVLAYPRWERMERLGALEATAGESEGRRKARTGSDTSGTRAYAHGDSFRIIHWRNSARSGRLSVREFDTWNDRSIVFAIDAFNVHGEGSESTLDYAARIAASVAKVVEAENGAVSVVTGLSESPDYIAWSGVMERLALLDIESGAGDLAAKIDRLQTGQRMMAFLSPGSAVEARAVIEAARRGVTVAAVIFEGFDENVARDSSIGATLSQAGVRTVTCRPGQLHAAISEIERGVSAARSRSDEQQRRSANREAA